ncbi:MAG: 16S rRNA (cytosine(1402)-N(4))-methyltransferase RsmH [Eubacteriales bacterium]|nr:16S rRNA (cytosine(1402)-N(4))-methyltransferase RsmH [Eubacteriales bacterium]
MNIDTNYHVPILLNEILENLITNRNGIYVDGTLGGGGHTIEILKSLSPDAKHIGIDRDPEAIVHASSIANHFSNFTLVHNNFHNLPEILENLNISKIDGCLLDLGVSSHQIDTPDRGFSYNFDAPLDMRMDNSKGISAKEYLNTVSKQEFERILYNYADESWAKRIADKLIEFRATKPLKTTFDLVTVVDNAIPQKVRYNIKGHSAKKTFQAVRIAVNDEIQPLENALTQIIHCLKPGGRLCVITFHSIEDRIVKNCFRTLENPCTCPPKAPICTCGKVPLGKSYIKKPILPQFKELNDNNRSHSAKLRIFERK